MKVGSVADWRLGSGKTTLSAASTCWKTSKAGPHRIQRSGLTPPVYLAKFRDTLAWVRAGSIANGTVATSAGVPAQLHSPYGALENIIEAPIRCSAYLSPGALEHSGLLAAGVGLAVRPAITHRCFPVASSRSRLPVLA